MSRRSSGWPRRSEESIDLAAATLAALAMVAMFRFKVGLPKTLAASAALGAAWKFFGPAG